MEFPLTPVETLEKHYNIARNEGLKYVYIGNVPGHKLEHTYCPECGMIVIQRYGFDIISWNLNENNRCRNCSNPISIIGKPKKIGMRNRFKIIH